MILTFEQLDHATDAAIDRQNELMERCGYKPTEMSRSLIREAVRAALESLGEPLAIDGSAILIRHGRDETNDYVATGTTLWGSAVIVLP